MNTRQLSSWKFAFYRGFLPALRQLGPARADAALSALGQAWAAADPCRRRLLEGALTQARAALGEASTAHWPDTRALVPAFSVGALRFLARDYLLDTKDDAFALSRFDVSGVSALQAALDAGRGAVLVGGHLGGHLSAFHYLYRSRLPVRLMVQRPHHVSSALGRFFDRDEPDPQSGYFLRRALEPGECVARMLRARAALRAGRAVYLPGDIPWSGPNTRPGRLLGQTHPLLSVWADLAALTQSPVFFLTCRHQPAGRFALRFEPLGTVAPGGEAAAVAHYLNRLERAIAESPTDAVAHLLWPCYGPPRPSPSPCPLSSLRPSRRAAVAARG